MIDKNFPNMGKETVTQVEQVQRISEDIPKEEHGEAHTN